MTSTSMIIRKNLKQHVDLVLKTGYKIGDKKERLDFRTLHMKTKKAYFIILFIKINKQT